MESSQNKKRNAWSFQLKLEALDLLKSGKTQAEVTQHIGAGESMLRGWIKDEANLLQATNSFDASKGLHRKLRTANDNSLDKIMYAWFMQECAERTLVSGESIRSQAEKLKKDLNKHCEAQMGEKEFKASKGWLSRWKKGMEFTRLQFQGIFDLPTPKRLLISNHQN